MIMGPQLGINPHAFTTRSLHDCEIGKRNGETQSQILVLHDEIRGLSGGCCNPRNMSLLSSLAMLHMLGGLSEAGPLYDLKDADQVYQGQWL